MGAALQLVGGLKIAAASGEWSGPHRAARQAPVQFPGIARVPTFPLHHRAGRAAIVTTDEDLREQLLRRAHGRYALRAFRGVDAFLNELQQEPPRWEHDLWLQQQIVERARRGRPLIPEVLRYWATHSERLELTTVCVVDDFLCDRSGHEILSELVGWSGRRVLLSNGFDDGETVDAVNSGLIERVIRCGPQGTVERLDAALSVLMASPNERFQRLWADSFNGPQLEALREPLVLRELRTLAEERWVEWIGIGQPFGILGIDSHGVPSWLQLQLASELDTAIGRAMTNGLGKSEVDAVANRRSILDIDFQTEIGYPAAGGAVPAFHLGDKGRLLCAWRAIPAGLAHQERTATGLA